MEFASALTDDIGPRLTGSPNMAKANAWTRDQLTAMGCVNAHLDDWGEFGMGWQQLNTWVRMIAPDTAVFIAQATPWSPATSGPVTGEAVYVNIQDEKDFDQYQRQARRQNRPPRRNAPRSARRSAPLRALHRRSSSRTSRSSPSRTAANAAFRTPPPAPIWSA